MHYKKVRECDKDRVFLYWNFAHSYSARCCMAWNFVAQYDSVRVWLWQFGIVQGTVWHNSQAGERHLRASLNFI